MHPNVRRVLSTRGAAAPAPVVPWYLAGDVPAANCKAAYQFVGAESKVASLINLANPGTYDAVDTANPWTTELGIKVAEASETDEIQTNYPPGNTSNRSVIIKVAGVTFSPARSLIFMARYGSAFYGIEYNGTNMKWRNGTGSHEQAETFLDGVLAIAGLTAYRDGVSEGSITAGTYDLGTATMGIGTYPGGYYSAIFYAQAFAVYDTTLTADQIAAITGALNLLPF